MPWYLPNGDASAVSLNSLTFKGGQEIRARQGEYRKPDGSRDLDSFRRDLWQHQTIHFVRKRKTPCHALPSGSGCFLSDSVKAVIDRLEPGVHQPIGVKLFAHNGEPWPEPFWYYQHSKIPRVDAIDIEKSRVRIRPEPYPGGGIFDSPILFAGPVRMETYLDARNISGHHFFGERRTTFKFFFFSDELVSELKAADLLHGFKIETVGLTHLEDTRGAEQ